MAKLGLTHGVVEVQPLPGRWQRISHSGCLLTVQQRAQGLRREGGQGILADTLAADPAAQVLNVDGSHTRTASSLTSGSPSATLRASHGLGR
ncbi:hypothetical protein D9M70_615560 [compost metagenome]